MPLGLVATIPTAPAQDGIEVVRILIDPIPRRHGQEQLDRPGRRFGALARELDGGAGEIGLALLLGGLAFRLLGPVLGAP